MNVVEKSVFDAVSRCLGRMVRGSGHMASYHLEDDGFVVTGSKPIADGLTEYSFKARARYETEHVSLNPGATDEVEGAIVLDLDLQLTFDEEGQVRIQPGPVLHPTRWNDPMDPAVQAEDAHAMTRPA